MGKSQADTAFTSSRGIVFYPFLAAIFPIISVLSSNAPDVPLPNLVVPVLGMLGAAALLWLVLGVVLRDARKRGVLLLGVMVLFWSYGAVLDSIRAALHYRETISGLKIVPFAALEFGVAVGLFIYLRRTRRSLAGTTRFLNVASGLGVALAIGSTMLDYGRIGARTDFPTERPSVSVTSDVELRDIVYIIADAYGRHDVIRDVYGYDNTTFVEALENRGFYVAREARANYNVTRFSVSSSMNFQYVDGIAEELGGNQSTSRLIQHSRLHDWLEARNYRFVSFATGYSGTEMHGADEYLEPRNQITEFQQILIDMTPLRSVMNRVRSRKAAKHGARSGAFDVHRDRVLFALDGLREMEWTKRPEFVFAHIVSPHWPYVLDEFSNPVYPDIRYNLSVDYPDWEKPTWQEFAEGYRKQVQGLNRLLLDTIDEVQRANPEALIILQGDHGPRKRAILPDPGPWQDHAREELAILSAYYLPGVADEDILYPEISPVNTFRVILNTYFEEDFPLLEDRSSLWIHRDGRLHAVSSDILDGAAN